jgi:hypothetical protein
MRCQIDRSRFSTYRSKLARSRGRLAFRKRRLPSGRENIRHTLARVRRLRCPPAYSRAASRHGSGRAQYLFPGSGRMGTKGFHTGTPGESCPGHTASRVTDCMAKKGAEAPLTTDIWSLSSGHLGFRRLGIDFDPRSLETESQHPGAWSRVAIHLRRSKLPLLCSLH